MYFLDKEEATQLAYCLGAGVAFGLVAGLLALFCAH